MALGTDRLDLDQDLASRGFGDDDLVELQDVGAAVPVEAHCAHGLQLVAMDQLIYAAEAELLRSLSASERKTLLSRLTV